MQKQSSDPSKPKIMILFMCCIDGFPIIIKLVTEFYMVVIKTSIDRLILVDGFSNRAGTQFLCIESNTCSFLHHQSNIIMHHINWWSHIASIAHLPPSSNEVDWCLSDDVYLNTHLNITFACICIIYELMGVLSTMPSYYTNFWRVLPTQRN